MAETFLTKHYLQTCLVLLKTSTKNSRRDLFKVRLLCQMYVQSVSYATEQLW